MSALGPPRIERPEPRSRDQLLALARRGQQPWEVLRAAVPVWQADPADDELALLVASQAASLGLPALGLEVLSQRSASITESEEARRLREQFAECPDDRMSPARLLALAADRLEKIRPRVADCSPLDQAMDRFESELQQADWLRANDGNVIVRDADGRWGPLIDRRAAVGRIELAFAGSDDMPDPASPPKPLLIEGIHPPWLLERIWCASRRWPDGYAPAIMVAQSQATAFLAGLALMEKDDLAADPRLRYFVGPNAASELEAHLLERTDYSLPDRFYVTPGLEVQLSPDVPAIVRKAHAAQQQAMLRLTQQTQAAYAGCTPEYWKQRYIRGLRGDGEPLRIVLPISRYSTFVRHSAQDLAAELDRLGCQTRLLTEPDNHTKLASTAYLKVFAEWRPDLVILINYTRGHMGSAVPAQVPFVCWIQDRMPQLFSEQVGRTRGPLDFLIGHLHPTLFQQFGYPRRNSLFRFVPASSQKFHDGPVDKELAARFRCDLAYIGHQSETPAAAHERLLGAFRDQPRLLPVVQTLFRAMEGQTNAGLEPKPLDVLKEVLEGHGLGGLDPRVITAIWSNYAHPVAERLFRHATLRWAVELATANGWNLALYGNGWDRHPEWSPYARPALSHDDQLRAAYQSATCQLHASIASNAHQRVLECALSGGLTLRRGPSPDGLIIKQACARLAWQMCEPYEQQEDGHWLYHFNDSFGLSGDRYRRARRCESAPSGVPMDEYASARPGLFRIKVARELREGGFDERVDVPLSQIPDYIFDDAHETLFVNRDELESMVLRAMTDGAWRQQTIANHRRAVLERMTYRSLADDLLEFVGQGLGVDRIRT